MLEIVGHLCRIATAASRSPNIPHTLSAHPLPKVDPLVTVLGHDTVASQHVCIVRAPIDCRTVAGESIDIARTQHYSEEAEVHSVEPSVREAV